MKIIFCSKDQSVGELSQTLTNHSVVFTAEFDQIQREVNSSEEVLLFVDYDLGEEWGERINSLFLTSSNVMRTLIVSDWTPAKMKEHQHTKAAMDGYYVKPINMEVVEEAVDDYQDLFAAKSVSAKSETPKWDGPPASGPEVSSSDKFDQSDIFRVDDLMDEDTNSSRSFSDTFIGELARESRPDGSDEFALNLDSNINQKAEDAASDVAPLQESTSENLGDDPFDSSDLFGEADQFSVSEGLPDLAPTEAVADSANAANIVKKDVESTPAPAPVIEDDEFALELGPGSSDNLEVESTPLVTSKVELDSAGVVDSVEGSTEGEVDLAFDDGVDLSVDAGVEPATNDRVELAADDSVDLGVDQGDDFATDDNFMSEAVDSGIDLFEGESDQAADFENEFKDSVDSAPDQSVTLDVGTDEGVALDAVVDEGISLDAGADEGLAFDSVAEESGDVESSLVEEEEFNLSSDNEMTDDVLDRMFSSATNRQFEDSTGGRQKWISESVDLPGPKQSEDSTGWISDAPVTAATRSEPESMLGGEITNIAELREQRDERESQEQQQEQYNKGTSSPRSVPLVSSENEARELFEGQYRQAEQERARELAQMACRQASEQTQVLADAKARLDAHEQEERLVAEEESRLLALQEIERKSAEIANKSVFDAEVEGEERLLSALVEVRESIDEIEDQGVDLKLVAEEPPVGVVREDFEDISYGSLEGFAHDESIDATRVIPDLDLLTGVRALPEESDAGLDSSLEADSDSSLAQAELFADSLAENKEGGDFELGDLKQSDLGLDERGELQQEQALKEQERLKGQIGEGVEQELDIAMLEAMSSNVSALADDAEPLEISGDTDLATSTDDLMAKTDEDETLQMDVDLSPIEGLEDSVASGDSSQQEFRYDRDKGDDKESSISTAAVRVDSDELFRSSITINNLREEREGLLVELDTARVETREEKRSALGYRAELDEVKIELAILKKRYHSQLDDLQDKLRVEMDRKLIYEEKIKRFDSEVERLNSKLRIDVSQVKKREQELENQLELLQFDTAAQIESRDKKIISLKRHIDAMEFNMETMEIHKQKALAEKEQVSQRLDRVMKTLRGSVDMLEDEVTPLGDDEIIRRMSDR